MKKLAFLILSFVFSFTTLLCVAQEEPAEKDNRPVRAPFESAYLIDAQTVYIPTAKTLEFVIHHRFGVIENGISDLYGIYAPSNIRLGLNYSITNDLMVGIGTTKFKKMQDIQWKYSILKQTRSNTIPVSVSYFGNLAITAVNKDNLMGDDTKFTNRFSYFNQIIISRKINDHLSIQIAPSFTHYNFTSDKLDHDRIALSFSGRYKFSPQSSILFSYDHPFFIEGITEYTKETNKTIPNFCIGYEVSTSTHAFQIVLGASDKILHQENIMYNQNDFFKSKFVLGFNMTRLWNF